MLVTRERSGGADFPRSRPVVSLLVAVVEPSQWWVVAGCWAFAIVTVLILTRGGRP